MMTDTAFQAQLGAIFLLAVVSVLLIGLQVDRFDAHKRKFALWSMAVFLAGAGAIWYLEKIKSYFWDKSSITGQARSGLLGGGWEGGGKGRRGGGSGRNGGGEDEANAGLGEDGEEGARVRYPQFVRNNRFQESADCPEMVIIPAGNDGAPIPHFALGRFEVSVAEFHKFVVHSGYAPSRACEGMATEVNAPAYLQAGLRHAGGRPVACVSWQDAQAYTAWLSAKTGQPYRLPSPREWTHAAHGGTASVASVSGARFPVQKISWQGGNVRAAALAQLSIPASSSNGYGVFDMAGGVAEWVYQCAEGAGAIVSGGASRHAETLRGCLRQAMGGSWADGEGIDRVRASGSGTASPSIGLRVARDLPKFE
jgi:hypothetical protein